MENKKERRKNIIAWCLMPFIAIYSYWWIDVYNEYFMFIITLVLCVLLILTTWIVWVGDSLKKDYEEI